MKKKGKTIISALVILCTLIPGSRVLKAENKVEIINEVIKQVQGNIIENGILTTIDLFVDKADQLKAFSKEEEKNFCIDLLKKLKSQSLLAQSIENVNTTLDEGSYYLEFFGNNASGYIESRIYDNHNIISINLKYKSDKNNLEDLKQTVSNVLSDSINGNNLSYRIDKISYNYYLKASLQEKNLKYCNDKIVKTLKDNDVSEIESISIEKGYSIVAFTKQYEKIKNNGKWMDINIALNSYSSGDYITIGTPTINNGF